jgi:type I restriction enzyme S subunit
MGLAPADYATYQIFEPNDLAFKLIDLENISTSRVGIVPERGIMSSAYIRFSSRKPVNIRYYYYQYHDWWLRQVFNGLGAGVRQTLSAPDLLNLKIAVPPREEQDQIVRYLDWQISKINKLIHGYQREIKLIEERKLTIINDAVVHGIDSHVERAESKASWMGLVPVTWQQMRMKNFFKEVNVRSTEGKEPHLSMSQKLGLVTDEENIGRPLLSESYAGAKLCERDDLVLNRLKAHLGVFALAPIQGIVSPDYTVLRLDRGLIIPKFAEYLLKSNDCRKELRIRVRGIVEGFWRLYTEDLGSIPVCLPNIEEQNIILQYIEEKSAALNVAITNISKQIELLKEYRTLLISDVVTGQMDVRGIEVPDYSPEEDTEETDEDIEETEVDPDAASDE